MKAAIIEDGQICERKAFPRPLKGFKAAVLGIISIILEGKEVAREVFAAAAYAFSMPAALAPKVETLLP